MMNGRIHLILFMMAILLFGCKSSSKNSTHKNTVVLSVTEDPQTLDPRKMRDIGSINFSHMFYEGLTRVNPEGKIELAAADNIDISDDLMTYTIHLRDAKWSDGTPLTASDFVDTWRSTLQPNFMAPNAYQLYVIEGAKEAKEGKIPVDDVKIAASDSNTITIKLKEPTPYFQELLSCQFFYPVHASLREGRSTATPISNGPFKLARVQERQQYTFTKDPGYWDVESVLLDGIDVKVLSETTALQLFKAGQLHWTGSPLSTLPQDSIHPLRESKKLLVAPSAATQWFRFNTKKGPFTSAHLRQAFTRALDRKSIVENVTQGNQFVALAVVPPFMNLHPISGLSDNDVVGARTLLEEKGKPSSVTLSYIANDRGHKIAQAVQQQWEKALGIKVALEGSEQKALFEKMKNGDYDMCLGSWYGDITDPVNFLEIFQYANNPTNQTFWENAKYAALLEAAAKEKVPEKRLELLSRAETILLNDLPVAPLMYPTYNYLKNDHLKGVYFSPLGFLDFRQAYFAED